MDSSFWLLGDPQDLVNVVRASIESQTVEGVMCRVSFYSSPENVEK